MTTTLTPTLTLMHPDPVFFLQAPKNDDCCLLLFVVGLYTEILFIFCKRHQRESQIFFSLFYRFSVCRCNARDMVLQLREAKGEAEAASEATRRDIDKLRGLHARRVKRLEALLKEEGENLADARREIGTAGDDLLQKRPTKWCSTGGVG